MGGAQETGLHLVPLHLAKTDSIWASLCTLRQQKSQTALTSLEEDSRLCNWHFCIPSFQVAICYHSGSFSRSMGDFIMRLLCSPVRPRTSNHLVPRPEFQYTRPGTQMRGWPRILNITFCFSLFKSSIL